MGMHPAVMLPLCMHSVTFSRGPRLLLIPLSLFLVKGLLKDEKKVAST